MFAFKCRANELRDQSDEINVLDMNLSLGLLLKKITLTVYSENCVYWINFHAVSFQPKRSLLRFYLPCVFVSLTYSFGVRYACRLLGSSLIINVQVFEAEAFRYINRLCLKIFLLFALKK